MKELEVTTGSLPSKLWKKNRFVQYLYIHICWCITSCIKQISNRNQFCIHFHLLFIHHKLQLNTVYVIAYIIVIFIHYQTVIIEATFMEISWLKILRSRLFIFYKKRMIRFGTERKETTWYYMNKEQRNDDKMQL